MALQQKITTLSQTPTPEQQEAFQQAKKEMAELRTLAEQREGEAEERNIDDLEAQISAMEQIGADPVADATKELSAAATGFMEKISKAEGVGGKFKVLLEQLGKIKDTVFSALGSFGRDALNSLASGLEFFGISPAIVEKIRSFANAEQATIKHVLEEAGFQLIRNTADGGKNRDAAALNSLKRRYDAEIKQRADKKTKEEEAKKEEEKSTLTPAEARTLATQDFTFEAFTQGLLGNIAQSEINRLTQNTDGKRMITLTQLVSFTKEAAAPVVVEEAEEPGSTPAIAEKPE